MLYFLKYKTSGFTTVFAGGLCRQPTISNHSNLHSCPFQAKLTDPKSQYQCIGHRVLFLELSFISVSYMPANNDNFKSLISQKTVLKRKYFRL